MAEDETPTKAGTTFHFCLDVRGAIRNRSFAGFTRDDGREATEDEALDFLLDQVALGRRVIPMGPCEGFNYETGCPGHPETKQS